jgi:hypothetical protein
MSNLSKPITIRFTKDQWKALQKLKEYGFNKDILIRKALDEVLHREFRSVLKELKQQENKTDHPDWAF